MPKETNKSDPLYQAQKRVRDAQDAIGDATVEFVNGMTLRAMTYALIAIAEELRRANDEIDLEKERQEIRDRYR